MGNVIRFPAGRKARAALVSWRTGGAAQRGPDDVKIVACDGGESLVVGQTGFEAWSKWLDASELRLVAMRGGRRTPAHPGDGAMSCIVRRSRIGGTTAIEAPPRGGDAVLGIRQTGAERERQRDREMEWENEGGRAWRD